MLGWLIILIVCVLVVVLIIALDGFFDAWGFVCVVFGIIGLVSLGFVVFAPLRVNKNIEGFREYQKYINEEYEFENQDSCIFMEDENYDTLGRCVTDTMVYDEILGYNMWLTRSRASQRGYGIFSFYKNKDLDELEYIKIEKGE